MRFLAVTTPLLERPIFHQLEQRVKAHIFICILAHHLLALVEKLFRDKGIATSWETIGKDVKTHQVVTVVMPHASGKRILRLRRGTTPEKLHSEIYKVLDIPEEPMQPHRTWSDREACQASH